MSLFTLPHTLNSPRWNGMRVGLLGGSFNPPHEGHVHISLSALKGLELDAVWWLVTPQNPIKTKAELSMTERVSLSRALTAAHPKILVSDIETALDTTITYETVRHLKKRFPKCQFVWISGMDNALSLHKWHHWHELLEEICMVHLTRKPASSLIQRCPLRLLGRQKHVVVGDKGGRFPLDSGTTYWMLQKKMVNISSTELREKRPSGQNP
ncbi:MAG: nicotinate (nicotinamide) nucleotide adenylyltransferase [Alphaproteobacteria bacterium]